MEEVKTIKLGDKVLDSITGFTGVAVSITKRLAASTRIAVQGEKLIKGVPVELQYFDEERLEVL